MPYAAAGGDGDGGSGDTYINPDGGGAGDGGGGADDAQLAQQAKLALV